MYKQEIIFGNALEELKKIESESIDLIVSDPPYNLGKDYGNNHDIKGFDKYLDFSKEWLTEAKRVLKPNGTIYIFMGFRFISYLYNILDRDLEMFFNSWVVWHYTQGIGKKKGFSPRHDDVLVFTKSKNFVFNLDAIRVPQKYYRERNNMRGANPGDVWEFSHVHYCNENRENHPTQKPEGLIERMILASSNEGGVVLEPFLGSGTTLRVCQQLNRKGIGIEMNPNYVDIARVRLGREFTGFDSVDPRASRVPFDLRNDEVREEYLDNHKKWFLKNHENATRVFEDEVERLYGHYNNGVEQMALLEPKTKYQRKSTTRKIGTTAYGSVSS